MGQLPTSAETADGSTAPNDMLAPRPAGFPSEERLKERLDEMKADGISIVLRHTNGDPEDSMLVLPRDSIYGSVREFLGEQGPLKLSVGSTEVATGDTFEALGMEADSSLTVTILKRSFLGFDAEALLKDIERIEAEYNASASEMETSMSIATRMGFPSLMSIAPIDDEYLDDVKRMFSELCEDDFKFMYDDSLKTYWADRQAVYISAGDRYDRLSILLEGRMLVVDQVKGMEMEILPLVTSLCVNANCRTIVCMMTLIGMLLAVVH